ncbi:Uncharacterized protein PECH_000486 [Penicillium ucsense]|uniref:SET domain-containing protein n=1 Tax=Penicillium ucsense TaxID=2839758 RepID=A0A8J8W6S2_9EURO|nr:Uncharacterized protein PECM_004122 [Penicillium ucsense]KAF7733521.1 Uncharacterized protein PECH_000486 [Penicillium ucsense]
MKRASYPAESLAAWLHLNGVTSNGVSFQRADTGDLSAEKGTAVIATESRVSSMSDAEPTILFRVPADLVLSLETVHGHAKSDQHLREVLDAVGAFGTTTRGAILIFLLLQLTHSSPEIPQRIGVSSPWAEYVKFFPESFPLPTFYRVEEVPLLEGTSLSSALKGKVTALEKEFEHLRQSTESIPWCRQCWWDADTGRLSIEDWQYVDAAYRSRMVDLPNIGHSIVPCIDMANHTGGGEAKALYDVSSDGSVILQLRWGQGVQPGEEVTISYGDEKPASEMLFTYGFLPDDLADAKQVLLDVTLPEDDPLAVAKNMFCRKNPGLKLSVGGAKEGQTDEAASDIHWESQLIWWASVNEEDGLHIGVAQRTDGTKELEASWKDHAIQSCDQLLGFLTADPSWEIFQLRAVMLVLQRVETQLASLHRVSNVIDSIRDDEALTRTLFRPEVMATVSKLRTLEEDLLQRSNQSLIIQRNTLVDSPAVMSYLKKQLVSEDVEDFS